MDFDNASSNDTAIGFFEKKLMSWGSSAVRSKYLHMRCIAHILNLVVQDGLRESDKSFKKVRDCVRYMRNSPSRLQKFRDLSDLIGVEAKYSLVLDVPTRWNSTYMMLHTALLYEKVFEAYEDHDSSFISDLGGKVNIPDEKDWETVKGLVKFLKSFYEMTVRISGSLYVTSNTFFSEVSDLSCILKDLVGAESESVNLMGKNMKAKFDKYWVSKPLFHNVMNGLKELYADYVASFLVQSAPCVSVGAPVSVQDSAPSVSVGDPISVGRPQALLKSQLKKQRLGSGELAAKKTELEVYLSEGIVEEDGDFDLLRWWMLHQNQHFSTNGRVLDAFRSSHTSKIVEALICAQDWLRLTNQPLKVEENIDEVEKFEKELCGGIGVTTGVDLFDYFSGKFGENIGSGSGSLEPHASLAGRFIGSMAKDDSG
ncbi:PREDICTED: zinc finger BED domain-containing protein RICESLEEPER 2-like [Ipomoea nil]|uniref:zinc finger BED domain-containing protein RICESLEEPER 2-like n=1 Tax=Ipomoea nil TaxID=35883 RepID=UPI000901BFAF|nr:PREDICTED: zinc finger BED domain-containing protein RICESLEEPER 2-like [Ipomoea nil]